MCLYVYSTQFVYRHFFCNFLVLALLAKLFEEDIISFTAWSNQHCILSEEGEGGVSINLFSIFSDNFWGIYIIDEGVFFMDKIYRKIFVGLY